ncbi:MAG TPA: transcription termination/antitermination protein NusG [Spirochaetota bacterium]|nr:transcription termination/antitermination protein NusG [Spirochaetota bacterium]HPJ36873.1 transcription termination/antitermination protein NusG [Spirochaetota bacterium]HPQ51810.1 transcription termination/antitermination protein NusG [Spirochaetota bacterium]
MMTKEWYVIHTHSGHENKVKTALEKKLINLGMELETGFRIKIPTLDVAEIRDGKKRVKSKKVFPGYVLIETELTDDVRKIVKDTPGVTNFLGVFDYEKGSFEPKALSKNEVNSLFAQVGEQKVKEKVSASMEFSVGEHVKVVDGPFSNFSGVIEEVYPEKGRLRVKVEIFGRGTPVELDFLQVGKI